jgi:hypothetical protein
VFEFKAPNGALLSLKAPTHCFGHLQELVVESLVEDDDKGWQLNPSFFKVSYMHDNCDHRRITSDFHLLEAVWKARSAGMDRLVLTVNAWTLTAAAAAMAALANVCVPDPMAGLSTAAIRAYLQRPDAVPQNRVRPV